MKNEIICGIYKITSPSGRVYIGQSKDIEDRHNDYMRLNNCKGQTKLYRSFLKYGVKNHIFEIIEECDILELNNREGYWQDFYDVVKKGLNCLRVTTDDRSGFLSEETIEKIKLAKSNGTCRDTRVYNRETKEVYKSIKEASIKCNITYSVLKSQLRGVNKNTTSLEYLDKENAPIKVQKTCKITLCTQTGIFYDSLKDAAIALSINYRYLKAMMNGSRNNKTSLIYA